MPCVLIHKRLLIKQGAEILPGALLLYFSPEQINKAMAYFTISKENEDGALWLKNYVYNAETGELFTSWSKDENEAGFFFKEQIQFLKTHKSLNGSTLLLYKRNADGTNEAPIYLSIVLS